MDDTDWRAVHRERKRERERGTRGGWPRINRTREYREEKKKKKAYKYIHNISGREIVVWGIYHDTETDSGTEWRVTFNRSVCVSERLLGNDLHTSKRRGVHGSLSLCTVYKRAPEKEGNRCTSNPSNPATLKGREKWGKERERETFFFIPSQLFGSYCCHLPYVCVLLR